MNIEYIIYLATKCHWWREVHIFALCCFSFKVFYLRYRTSCYQLNSRAIYLAPHRLSSPSCYIKRIPGNRLW